MKERPLIFTAESVRAILEGRKTQTRRVAKPFADNVRIVNGVPKAYSPGCPEGWVIASPYGVPGDRLWVREGFHLCVQPAHGTQGTAGKPYCVFPDGGQTFSWCGEYHPPLPKYDPGAFDRLPPKKSPLFMPRWASRLTLEITDIRVQRVQEISHEDALAEGCRGLNWVASSPYIAGPHTDDGELPVEEYQRVWNEINAKRGHSWASNPWVWAITFKKV